MAGAQRPYVNAIPITPGTPFLGGGEGVLIACTVAGNQSIKMRGGQTMTVPVAVGITLLDDFGVIDAPVAGTTATATVYILGRA